MARWVCHPECRLTKAGLWLNPFVCQVENLEIFAVDRWKTWKDLLLTKAYLLVDLSVSRILNHKSGGLRPCSEFE
jgi:hypothetical protein